MLLQFEGFQRAQDNNHLVFFKNNFCALNKQRENKQKQMQREREKGKKKKKRREKEKIFSFFNFNTYSRF